jgi:hypothetical protein
LEVIGVSKYVYAIRLREMLVFIKGFFLNKCLRNTNLEIEAYLKEINRGKKSVQELAVTRSRDANHAIVKSVSLEPEDY